MAAQVRAPLLATRTNRSLLSSDSRRFWPKVTARHLLSQTGGCVTGETSGLPGYPECYSAPGTNWTYDSEDFIGHLSLLVNATAGGVPAVEWATKNFAEVLGLGDLYKWDDDGTNFAAGGGQMMSCRQHAKVGQLLANRGAWPSSAAPAPGGEVDGGEGEEESEKEAAAVQLIKPELCDEVLTPQMPHVSKSCAHRLVPNRFRTRFAGPILWLRD